MYTRVAMIAAVIAAPALRAEKPPADPAKAIAPLVDRSTYLVAHLDAGRIDPTALAEQIAALDLLQPAERRRLQEELTRTRTQFLEAGGRDVYVLGRLGFLPVPAVTVVVPVTERVDVPKMTGFLRGRLPGRDLAVEQVGPFLAAGYSEAVVRLAKVKAEPRPDLAAAFTAAGASALHVVLLPPPDLRRVVAELVPTLPKEIGGGPSSVLTRGVQWIAAGLDPPPKVGLRVVVQTPAAATARALQDLATRALAAAVKEVMARHQPADPHDPTALNEAAVARLLGALRPEVQGDRLVLAIPQKTFSQVSGTLVRLLRGPAYRSQGMNNLKQIALAMHNFHDVHGRFPANIVDKDGKPLLSWRVAILPYLNQNDLFKQFRLNEPWDSEHNKALLARMPAVYRRPSSRAARDATTYLMPVGKDTVLAGNDQGLDAEKGFTVRPDEKKGVRMSDITDGTSNTILAADVTDARAVPWTKPDDWTPDPADPRKGVVGSTPGGFLCAFADGSAHFLAATIDPKTVRALVTRNGGEVIPPF